MTSISVIVPSYNRANFLREAINSLTAQTRPVEEILVWDDGSTDSTPNEVKSLSGPIRYFRGENGGKAKALNAAMREARGELIWICDDDDIALPGAVERLAGVLERRPEAGVAAGSYVRFRDDAATGARVETGPGYWPDLSDGSVLRHLLEDIFLFQNATLVRRALYDKVGPFREDLARSIDYDMVVRLALQAPVVVLEEPLFKQRKHDGARGPAAARHAAAQSDAVWKQADRALFAPFRESIPLSLYAGLFDGALAQRAGLLQRACVFARRTDWDSAINDFKAAATMDPNVALSEVEQAICRRALAGKHGMVEATSGPVRARLVQVGRSGAVGTQIANALARGALWRGRAAFSAGRLPEAAQIARFILSLGLSARGPQPTVPAPPLSERREPLHLAV
ncbi:glycosyltransferase family 2 protein [Salipiger aestuarii]|uniref:Glycosyl transferase family 2 n=2 Tax=Salipiger aestuarii TaxID=568098 RepID=A0A327Y2A9_9RHOB|nr:glycosyltransferase family 2 protein [Salipiger aestuarii]RAK13875.1 glycosyl transferase family 2 [Salipiger aestuarii]